MAIIKEIYICPSCQEGITATERPKICPACKFHFGEEHVKQTYRAPETFNEQHARFNNAGALWNALISMPIEKANSMANDVLNIIQTLPAKKCKISDIRILIELCVQIGDVAKAYDGFIKTGGIHVPSIFIEAQEAKEQLKSSSKPKEEENNNEYTKDAGGSITPT